MATLRRAVGIVLLAGASCFYVPPLLRRPPAVRLVMDEADAPAADAAPATKITVRKPGGDGGDASAAAAPSATKVKVRVRSKSEKKASPPPAAAVEMEEPETTITVNVKAAPKKEKPPDDGKKIPELTVEENLLMEGTQRANITLILDALQQGANPNIQDPNGRTPLHFVAGLGLAPAVALLIHFGAQVNIRDNDDLTPIHMASGYTNAQTLRILVGAGADIDIAGKTQGKPLEVITSLGEYQLKQFMNRSGTERFTKKKDDKLEQLKECLDVLCNQEEILKEAQEPGYWDEIMTDVLKLASTDEQDLSSARPGA